MDGSSAPVPTVPDMPPAVLQWAEAGVLKRLLGVAAIGRFIPMSTSDKHHIKSVDRFLSNAKVDASLSALQESATSSPASTPYLRGWVRPLPLDTPGRAA